MIGTQTLLVPGEPWVSDPMCTIFTNWENMIDIYQTFVHHQSPLPSPCHLPFCPLLVTLALPLHSPLPMFWPSLNIKIRQELQTHRSIAPKSRNSMFDCEICDSRQVKMRTRAPDPPNKPPKKFPRPPIELPEGFLRGSQHAKEEQPRVTQDGSQYPPRTVLESQNGQEQLFNDS